MITDNAPKCCLQEVCRCMVTSGREFFLRIKSDLYGVATLYLPLFDIGKVIDRSIRKSLCIADGEIPQITAKDTFIAGLKQCLA